MAIAAMVQATVGVGPWDVLALGIVRHTPIDFGWTTDLIGLAVLLLWIPLRQRPGIGTVLNMLLIGPFAQFGLWVIPAPGPLWLRIALFAGGLLLLGVASGIYVAPQLGPGPRDGLMLGLHRRTGWPLWAVRTGIEASVLIIGWILGGQVGLGTLAEALLIGPIVHRTIPYFARFMGGAEAARRDRSTAERDGKQLGPRVPSRGIRR